MEADDEAQAGKLAQAAWETYAAAPAEFVATRTRWVTELRSEGLREVAREVAALRKPSVSAAAVNALVRTQDPVVARLRDVGTRLRHAQSALDAAGLAALRGERDGVLQDWVAAARANAPGPLTGGAETDVRDTAVAALADDAATEVVLSGTLTRSLSYSGFGEVDVSDAVARTSTGVVLTRIEGGGEDTDPPDTDEGGGEDTDPPDTDEDDADLIDAAERARLEESLAQAEERVVAARRARRTAQAEMEAAAARAEEAQESVARVRALLATAEDESAEAEETQDEARAALTDADVALADARERRDDARTALEEVEDAH